MPEIKFFIDGKEAVAQPGETILKVATRLGIEIPTLCFNQKVSKTTSCFVCVVKDKKTGKFLPSCSACPAPGQDIDASSDEVYEMRRTALGLLLSEHTGDCEAPCTLACPAHASVEEYVRAGRNGDFLGALKIIKNRIPLPMSIGRVCPRFCERDCRRNIGGKPVSINDVKRIAADLFYDTYMEELPALNGKKVAIVGAGPAGLSASYYLRLAGVQPVLFDQMPEAGGMLRYGIPEFRLPKATLRKELHHYEQMGIQFQMGKTLGKDFTIDSLKAEYDAVILAVGSWSSSAMRIDGEEAAQGGIKWLGNIAAKNWKDCENPGRTIVVGGGNTAIDCSRTALRLGGSVTIVYRRTQNEMPAQAIEIEEAREEGVKFEFLTAPLKLEKKADGSLALHCQRMQLGEPDASGRRSPVPVPGSDFVIEADTVISAIGQRTIIPEGMPSTKKGIEVCPTCMAINQDPKLYAAGDCVTGPATVVEAVAAGHKACDAVLASFEGKKLEQPFDFNVSRGHWRSLSKEDLVYLRDNISNEERVQPDYIDMNLRKTTFTELFPSIPAEKVSKEAERCLECSCTAKGECFLKKHATKYKVNPDTFKGEKPVQTVDTRHPYIIHDKQKCIRCGTCVKVCSEVINKSLLALMKRGFNTQVATAFDQGLPSYCKDCGACVNECPVGALDWKHKA